MDGKREAIWKGKLLQKVAWLCIGYSYYWGNQSPSVWKLPKKSLILAKQALSVSTFCCWCAKIFFLHFQQRMPLCTKKIRFAENFLEWFSNTVLRGGQKADLKVNLFLLSTVMPARRCSCASRSTLSPIWWGWGSAAANSWCAEGLPPALEGWNVQRTRPDLGGRHPTLSRHCKERKTLWSVLRKKILKFCVS